MIRYFDSSAWAKRYLFEPGTDEVMRFVQQASVATSRLTVVETASGIARRLREGGITVTESERMLAGLESDAAGILLIEVDGYVCRIAVEVLRRHALRAGDAVQLASALHLLRRLAREVEFICFDQRLNAAARSEGLLTPAAS